MSTWHQRQNPVPLWHETKWTLVGDPPGGCTTVMRFDTVGEAQACQNRRLEVNPKAHVYILPPLNLRPPK